MRHLVPAHEVLESFGGPVGGRLFMMGLVVLAAVLVTFFMLFWAIRSARWREATVGCPINGRTARVKMLLALDGGPIDVRRCSLHRRRVTCAKRCLDTA